MAVSDGTEVTQTRLPSTDPWPSRRPESGGVGRWVGLPEPDGSPPPSAPENYFFAPRARLQRRRTREGLRERRRPERRGGIPGEAAPRSPREEAQKVGGGGGGGRARALDAAGAGKAEPEPEPVRAPAIVARPPPPGASSAWRARSRQGPRTRLAGPVLRVDAAAAAGAPRPGRTGPSRPSREQAPAGASGRSHRRRCRLQKSPGLGEMGSDPRR